jgi:predicted nucleic acid-binding Zn ribbon protein
MPTYVYEVVLPDGKPGERFEVSQGMNDPPLAVHPQTGAPVRRVLTAPNIAGRYTEAAATKSMSDKNLERLGFTKYVKSSDGTYEKTVGQGPSQIKKPGPPS